MFDIASYIGIPFETHGRTRKACDCWGLVRLVYLEAFGIDLPSYTEEYSSVYKRTENGPKFEEHAAEWQAISEQDARPGDLILLYIFGIPSHVGIVTGNGFMLHTEAGIESCHESYAESHHWKDRKRVFLRHPQFAGARSCASVP